MKRAWIIDPFEGQKVPGKTQIYPCVTIVFRILIEMPAFSKYRNE